LDNPFIKRQNYPFENETVVFVCFAWALLGEKLTCASGSVNRLFNLTNRTLNLLPL
jgi:hypothetical protein